MGLPGGWQCRKTTGLLTEAFSKVMPSDWPWDKSDSQADEAWERDISVGVQNRNPKEKGRDSCQWSLSPQCSICEV